MLDEYRSSFSPAYEYVVGLIHNQLGLTPTGRQIKTTESIVAKLRRQKIRLSRMQDIAGCRVTVANAASQEQAAQELSAAFDNSKIIDRRKQPSHGYRSDTCSCEVTLEADRGADSHRIAALVGR